MSFNMTINSVQNIRDTKRGFRIYTNKGKNYLQKDGCEYELPSGNISMKNSDIFIEGVKLNIGEYVK